VRIPRDTLKNDRAYLADLTTQIESHLPIPVKEAKIRKKLELTFDPTIKAPKVKPRFDHELALMTRCFNATAQDRFDPYLNFKFQNN
jgi:hypothetical protein